jgi:hypothetical protein
MDLFGDSERRNKRHRRRKKQWLGNGEEKERRKPRPWRNKRPRLDRPGLGGVGFRAG